MIHNNLHYLKLDTIEAILDNYLELEQMNEILKIENTLLDAQDFIWFAGKQVNQMLEETEEKEEGEIMTKNITITFMLCFLLAACTNNSQKANQPQEKSIAKGAAIDKTTTEVVVDHNSINYMPFIQKPVSTKRENNTAWQKSDNDNPNVKRIIIFNVPEDEFGGMQVNADKIRQNFYTPDDKKSCDTDESRFRVDKVIYVTPPTKEEEKQGITQTDKTRQAFEQSKQFMEDQKALTAKQAVAEGKDPEAAVKALRFEGMANWFGHGTTVADKSPQKDDPRYYQEGSAEFKFIISPKEGIKESEIKKMEQNIKDYSYFPQYFVSCHSGAIIN